MNKVFKGNMTNWQNNGAIWIKTGKTGEKFLSFKASRDIKAGESLNFFKNDKKGVEKRPDYQSSTKIEDKNEDFITSKDLADDINF